MRRVDPIGLLTFLLALALTMIGIASLVDSHRPKIIECVLPQCVILRPDQPRAPSPIRKRGTEA